VLGRFHAGVAIIAHFRPFLGREPGPGPFSATTVSRLRTRQEGGPAKGENFF
jgi:hypothetical protein